MKKTKVLIFSNSIAMGGVRSAIVNLLKCIDEDKYDITVVAMFATDGFKELVSPNVKYKRIFPFYFRGYSHLVKIFSSKILYRFFVKDEYDVEIACSDGTSAIVISGSPNKKSQKLLWFHGDISKNHATKHCFKSHHERAEIYNKFNKLWFVSKGSMEGFNSVMGDEVTTERVVLHNPFFIDKIIERSKEKIKDFEKDRDFVFCTVGRMSKEKGYVRLVESFKQVNNKHPRTKLLFVGNGSEEEAIRKAIEENGLEEKVLLVGSKTNPMPYIAASDCYVCSSYTEALSSTVIEALILGVPTVTTDCAGMKDILGDNEAGLIVGQNTEELGEAMIRVIEDRDLYNKLKSNLPERSKLFRADIIEKQFDKIIGGK